MSEAKFTPGPWRANFEDYTKPYVEILNGDNLVIAQIPDGEIIRGDKTILGLENIEANIDLIADAWQLPDLRREIKELKEIKTELIEALEAHCETCKTEWDFHQSWCDCCGYHKAIRKAKGEGR